MDVDAAGRQRVDVPGWERAELFAFFRGFREPFHGVCVRVDCTETYRVAKERGLSVSLSLLHRSLVAAQGIENFRTQIADGAVWRYDAMGGGSAVGRPNGTIGFSHYPYRAGLEEFVREAERKVERVRAGTMLERFGQANLIRYSVLPWLDFTSISHARALGEEESSPRITFGKMTERDGRRTMPVSIHVHHGLVDGSHVAEFVGAFERLLGEESC